MSSINSMPLSVQVVTWYQSGGKPLTQPMASDADLWCFRWSAPEPTDEHIMETPVVWYAIALIMTLL